MAYRVFLRFPFSLKNIALDEGYHRLLVNNYCTIVCVLSWIVDELDRKIVVACDVFTVLATSKPLICNTTG